MHLFARQLCLYGAMLTLGTSIGFGQVVAVSDFSSIGRSLQRSRITDYNGSLYFSVGIDDTNTRELWRYDGTDLDLVYGGFEGETEISLGEFTEFQGALYFRGNAGQVGQELYRYDGRNVSLVADIEPGMGSSSPVGLYVHDDALYFSAQEGESFNNLWRYDGTNATRVASFDNPRASVVPGGSLDGNLYFGADDGVRGMELWQYDGSTVSLVADINVGATDSFPRDFTRVEENLYFKATTKDAGQEIWKFDGESVSILTDTNPGAKSSDPGYLTNKDGELFFSGVAYGDRSLYQTQGDRIVRLMEGGGPVDIGTGDLATIRGRRIGKQEVNDLYLLDGSYYRTTVASAASFETLQDNVYFSCECDDRELFRLAKSGDTNADGSVDFTDFLELSKNFGSKGDWESGDFTNDGVVTFGDFLGLSQNFGKENHPAHVRLTARSIPEPDGFLVGLFLSLVVLRVARRRRPTA